jgi:hypothetical protein
MTLRDFTTMSERAKTEVVELWGNQLAEKVVPGYHVRVYQVHNFYVEVYYNSQTYKIERHRACIRKETVCS